MVVLLLLVALAVTFFVLSATGRNKSERRELQAWLDARSYEGRTDRHERRIADPVRHVPESRSSIRPGPPPPSPTPISAATTSPSPSPSRTPAECHRFVAASSASSSVTAASISARWVNAWGKLPICSPVASISSEYRPSGLA